MRHLGCAPTGTKDRLESADLDGHVLDGRGGRRSIAGDGGDPCRALTNARPRCVAIDRNIALFPLTLAPSAYFTNVQRSRSFLTPGNASARPCDTQYTPGERTPVAKIASVRFWRASERVIS